METLLYEVTSALLDTVPVVPKQIIFVRDTGEFYLDTTDEPVHRVQIATAFIPDFVSGKLYKPGNVIVHKDSDTNYIYRAKVQMTPAAFDENQWELLGATAFGNVDGGKASSVYTFEQNINGGKARQ